MTLQLCSVGEGWGGYVRCSVAVALPRARNGSLEEQSMQHAAHGMAQQPRRKITKHNSSATRAIPFQANHPSNDVHEILQEAITRCINSRRSPSSSPRSKAGRQAGEERQAHSGRKVCCCSGGLRTDSSETGVCSHSCNAQNRKTRRPEAHQSRRCGQEEGIWSQRQAQTGSSFRRQSLIHHQEAAAC